MAEIANFPQNLLDLHHAWHQVGAHPPFAARAIPFGQPGSGLEFVQFHRDYTDQFHAWYDTQPGADPAAVAPWTAIPPEVKSPGVGWNANLAAQEQRILTNTPPFASADELGQFIENGIHNWIHGATASAFDEPVVGGFHSPRSTYFWAIHGLVDHWWQQWRAPKSRIKDIVDANPKGIVPDKIVPEGKQLRKDVIPDGKAPVKDVKEQLKELKEKDKDKDLVEGPGFGEQVVNPVVDPGGVQLQHLAQRLDALEGFVTRRSFIRPEERPVVGGHDAGGHDDQEPQG